MTCFSNSKPQLVDPKMFSLKPENVAFNKKFHLIQIKFFLPNLLFLILSNSKPEMFGSKNVFVEKLNT